MHSLHGPHPAPPGLGEAGWGVQRLLLPHSLRGAAGLGPAAGPGLQLRVGPQHVGWSLLDPLPKEGPGSTDLLRDTPSGQVLFSGEFYKAHHRKNPSFQGLCPEPAQKTE